MTTPTTSPVRLTALALCAAALAGCGDEPGAADAPASPDAAAPAQIAAPAGAAGPAASELAAAARAFGPPTAVPGGPAGFARGLPDEAEPRGLDYRNRSGRPEKATILEANGAGVALVDLGPDGDLDVVFGQGLGSLGELVRGPGADVEVFLNDGAGRFTRAEGPGLDGWWNGLATGDVDGDGASDVVVGGFGGLRVLLQRNGRLVAQPDLLEEAVRLVPGAAPGEDGPSAPPLWVTSLALCDLDRDGALDLYVGCYLELDPRDPTVGAVGDGVLGLPCRWKGQPVFCGPHGLVPQADRVYRGRGDGTFEDVTATWLPDHAPGFTLGVAAFDSDGDRDTDLYVANDSTQNLMLVNQIEPGGTGRLVDHAFAAGVGFSPDGAAEAGMGIAVGDVDRNGLDDLAVTNFSGEPTALYFAAPSGFTNETFRWGLNRRTRDLLSWGAHYTDFDQDGWLELFTANGHVYPQADAENTGTRYGQPDSLWLFGAGRQLLAVEPDASSVLAPAVGSRGSAVGDLDGDGRDDLVVTRIDGPAGLGINRIDAGHHRIELRLAGPEERAAAAPRTPRDANGARVVVAPRVPRGVEPFVLSRAVQTAVSYQSASSPWPIVGLGPATEAEVTVLWPSGATEELGRLAADRRYVVVEGRGVVRTEELP